MDRSSVEKIVDKLKARYNCVCHGGCDEAVIEEVESTLGVKFPATYRAILQVCGGAYCPALAREINIKNTDLPALEAWEKVHRLAPSNKEYWKAGMPTGYYLFAFDDMGNPFCFSMTPDDTAVYLFDHDLLRIDKLAPDLETLIGNYLRL